MVDQKPMQKEQLKQNENIRFRILTGVGQEITSILDSEDLLTRIVRLIQQTFGYYHVGIGLIEEDEVVYRVGAGTLWDDPSFQFKPPRLKVGSEGITGWVAQTGQVALVPDVKQDSHYVWMQNSMTRSELTVPIKVKGRIIGVLDAQSEQLDDFDQTDVEMLQSLANQAGIAIENLRLHEKAKQLAVLEERQRLARELHDSASQTMFSISLHTRAAQIMLEREPNRLQPQLEELQRLTRSALDEMRGLIAHLRPPGDASAGQTKYSIS